MNRWTIGLVVFYAPLAFGQQQAQTIAQRVEAVSAAAQMEPCATCDEAKKKEAEDKAAFEAAIRCPEGFNLSRSCKKLSGPHQPDIFSLCMKPIDATRSHPHINVVTNRGGKYMADPASFVDSKNDRDEKGKSVKKANFRGAMTSTKAPTPDRTEETYLAYSMVVNNSESDYSWTHKIYIERHNVVSTRNPKTNKWTDLDTGGSVGKNFVPNLYDCYAVE